jgi:hypothetical protein
MPGRSATRRILASAVSFRAATLVQSGASGRMKKGRNFLLGKSRSLDFDRIYRPDCDGGVASRRAEIGQC